MYISRYTTKSDDGNRDEYLDWVLEDGPPILRTVVQNILDEPIPEAVKKRLLKPLLPQPIPPPRKRNVKKAEGTVA